MDTKTPITVQSTINAPVRISLKYIFALTLVFVLFMSTNTAFAADSDNNFQSALNNTTSKSQGVKYRSYKNTELKYTMKVPENWNIFESEIFTMIGNDEAIVQVISSPNTTNQMLGEIIYDFQTELLKKHENLRIVKPLMKTKIEKKEANYTSYEFSDKDGKTGIMKTYFTMNKNQVYIINFINTKSTQRKYTRMNNTILRSFRSFFSKDDSTAFADYKINDGMTITYPKLWELNRNPSMYYLFLYPEESSEATAPNLALEISQFNSDVTYTNPYQSAEEAIFFTWLPGLEKVSHVDEFTEIKFGEEKFRVSTITYTYDGNDYQRRMYYTIPADNKVILFVYTAKVEDFDKHLRNAEDVITRSRINSSFFTK